MSVEQVEALLSEAATNPGFAAQLGADPAILTGYDLTGEEREALLSGDVDRLCDLGVDGELAKSARTIGR